MRDDNTEHVPADDEQHLEPRYERGEGEQIDVGASLCKAEPVLSGAKGIIEPDGGALPFEIQVGAVVGEAISDDQRHQAGGEAVHRGPQPLALVEELAAEGIERRDERNRGG